MAQEDSANSKKISSEGLAILIVDALIDAKIISKDEMQKSIDIVVEEIEARKAMEDY